jgi:outer membrane protein insertion porin family
MPHTFPAHRWFALHRSRRIWLVASGAIMLSLGAVRSHAQDPSPATAPVAEPATSAAGEAGATSEAGAEPYQPSEEPSFQVPRTACHGKRIDAIQVKGQRRVTAEDILATLDLRKGMTCTDELIAKDVMSLWGLDFFDHIAVEASEGSTTTLTYYVRERPSIGKISYTGNEEIEKTDLDEAVELRENAILSVSDLQSQVTKIRDLYAEKGFFLARVDYELKKLPDNEVEIVFRIQEGQAVEVRHLEFIGNHHVSDEEIKGVMATRPTSFFSFLSSGNKYKKENFEDDLTRLQVVYYDKGFLMVQVGTPRIEITPDRRYIDITVPVVEGPRFRVGNLEVKEVDATGLEVKPLKGKKKLRETITLEKGDWFSRATIAKDLQEIRRIYRDAGFANVQVEPQTQLDQSKRRVHVSVVITRGPKVYIERIFIGGNTKTRDKVIRREIQIFEGEAYSQTKVELSKARVTQLGFFERVEVSEEQGTQPDHIVLDFEVVERSTGTLQVGAGFSSFESFIFTSQIQQQNLFGNGQSLSLQMQISGLRQLLQLQFVEPYFLDTQWTLGLEAFKTIRQFQAFSRNSTGGSVTLGHPLFVNELRLFGQYKGEQVEIGSRTSGFFGAGGGAQGLRVFDRLPLANLFRSGFTSSIKGTLTWDSRDNRLFPTNGVYSSASTEIADSLIGSDNDFIRHRIFTRFYKPILAGIVFKANAEWGLVTSKQTQGVPVFERFFLGGILNVRGFPLFGLGPRAGLNTTLDPNSPIAPSGVVIGGNMQAFYNLELEFPILESVGIRGVVFTDGGNAWNTESVLCQAPVPTLGDATTDPCSSNILNMRHSWGWGIRWISPMGPLRFEWGVPINRRPYEQPVIFEFTMGNFF